jgi:hypothetical protein
VSLEVLKRLRGAIGTQIDHVEKHVHTVCLIARRIWRLYIHFNVQNPATTAALAMSRLQSPLQSAPSRCSRHCACDAPAMPRWQSPLRLQCVRNTTTAVTISPAMRPQCQSCTRHCSLHRVGATATVPAMRHCTRNASAMPRLQLLLRLQCVRNTTTVVTTSPAMRPQCQGCS